MSVAIVTFSKTDPLVSDLVASLSDVTDDLEVINPETYLRNCAKTKYLVKVLVVSKSLLKVTDVLGKNDVASLFEHRESVVVLLNDSSVDFCVKDKLSELAVNWSEVHEFDAKKLVQAEDVIKNKLIQNVERSFTQRYFIHPQTVSHLSGTEVLVVLGDDVGSSTNSVTVHFHGRKIEATKKQANVWMFNIDDMKPGAKLFRIMADGDDLGQNKLTVLGAKHTAEESIKELRNNDAREFLADLLCLDIDQFDLELADALGGSNCIQLVENILKYGDNEGNKYPTILHFCARFGLKGTLDWCIRARLHKNRLSTRDMNGKTAEQVAKEEHPETTFFKKFQDDGSNFGDLESLRSSISGREQSYEFPTRHDLRSSCPELPFRYPRRSGSMDSGRSSSTSIGTPSNNGRSTARRRLPSDPGQPLTITDTARPFDFSRPNRVEHPYDEIPNRDLSSTVYSQPWEESQLAANMRALTTDNSPQPRTVRDNTPRRAATLPFVSEHTKF